MHALAKVWRHPRLACYVDVAAAEDKSSSPAFLVTTSTAAVKNRRTLVHTCLFYGAGVRLKTQRLEGSNAVVLPLLAFFGPVQPQIARQ